MTDHQYSWLVSYLEHKDYEVFIFPVSWNHTTLTKISVDFVDFYMANKSSNNYILGFSYGAVIAFITASLTKPNKIILCSLSPDFLEDFKAMPSWLKKYIGKNRLSDIKTRSAKKIAKSINSKLVILYGEKEGMEYPQLRVRAEETVKLAQNAELIVVPRAPHNISFSTYQTAIKKLL